MDENATRSAEYARPVAKKGKNLRLRLLLILCYLLFAAAFCVAFTVLIMIPQVIAVLPVFLWILIFYTWRSVSYEMLVRVESGKLLFGKARGKKVAELLSVRVEELLLCAPYTDEYKGKAEEFSPYTLLDYRADPAGEQVAFAVIPKDGKRLLVLFQASSSVITELRYYNKATVQDKEYYRI